MEEERKKERKAEREPMNERNPIKREADSGSGHSGAPCPWGHESPNSY